MSNISEKAELSKRYTNHCIRVTGITNLSQANFNMKQIMSVSGHKSVNSLALYQRVQANEKLGMGISLSFCLMKPEESKMLASNIDLKQIQPPEPVHVPAPQPLAVPVPTLAIATAPNPEYQATNAPPIPLENAIVPFQPEENDDTPTFDIMSLIKQVQEEMSDDECVMAATQCEESIAENTKSTTTKALVKKSGGGMAMPTFHNCKFGNVQNLNIHIHKSIICFLNMQKIQREQIFITVDNPKSLKNELYFQ